VFFARHLQTLIQAGDDPPTADIDPDADAVAVMTVHKAKGLEFPVVILADMTARIAPTEASRHIDATRGRCALRIGGWSPRDLLLQQPIEQAREVEEGVRVAYVASTRARDLLVVPAVGDAEYDGWLAPLNGALYPPVDTRRSPRAASGCPVFRKDSVLQRPDESIATSRTVSPGAHRLSAADDGFDVVWWVPSILALGVEPPFGLRRQELIARDVAPEVVAEAQRRYLAWRERQQAARMSGARASVDVRTATEWVGADNTGELGHDVEVLELEVEPGRPSGVRFGTLVHAVLASVPLAADAAIVAAIVDTQGRIFAATEEEKDAASRAVAAALKHPLLLAARRAEHAGRCFRETPVTSMAGDVLVEGVVDLAFDDGEAVTIVDFKTDRASGDLLERYRRQVGLYADAIATVMSKPARPVLMKV
jgi:ATP-dependent exoDNAse (exonuclease V) beta subunit